MTPLLSNHNTINCLPVSRSLIYTFIFSPDAELRAKTLDFSLSDAVRSNDTPFVIGGVAKAGWEGRDQTWAFVKNKYPIFLERLVFY